MQNSVTIPCPFCGAETEIAVDTSLSDQQFTIDCENCCRPIEASLTCEDGEIVSANFRAG